MEVLECEKCLLTTEDGVKIANNGLCSLCNDFEEKRQSGIYFKDYKGNELESRKNLENNLKSIRNRKGRGNYDCLLHLSGGKDSVMVLYELKKYYDLKILAYMHDNGFESEAAKNNAKNATDILSVDLIYYKQEIARKPFYHFFRSGLYKRIDICTFCECFQEPFYAFAHHLMDVFNIPVEITGSAENADVLQPLLNDDYKSIYDFLKNKDFFSENKNDLLCQRVDNTTKRKRINYWAEIPQDMALTTKIVTECLKWTPKYSNNSDTGCNLCYIQNLLDEKYPSGQRRNSYKYIRARDIRMGHANKDFYNNNSSKLTRFEHEEIEEQTKKVLQIFDLTVDDL